MACNTSPATWLIRQQSKDILALLSGISQVLMVLMVALFYNFPKQCCNDEQWFSQNAGPAPDEATSLHEYKYRGVQSTWLE